MLKTFLTKSKCTNVYPSISKINKTKNSIKKLDLRLSFTQVPNEPNKETKSYELAAIVKKVTSTINNAKTFEIKRVNYNWDIIVIPKPMLLAGTVVGSWYGVGIGCFGGFGFQFYPNNEILNGGFNIGSAVMGGTGSFNGIGIGLANGVIYGTSYDIQSKK